MSNDLTLNICPVSFADASIKVGILPFQSAEHLRDLRGKHRQTHVFKRLTKSGSDRILVVRTDGKPCELGDHFESVLLSKELGLVANLLSNALIGFFYSNNYAVVDP